MPTLCDLHLPGCVPVSAPPLVCHFLLFHFFFFMLHALCWETGWDLYCQWTPEPVTALYTVWSGSKLEVPSLPLTIFSVYHVSCLLYIFFQIRWERDVGSG